VLALALTALHLEGGFLQHSHDNVLGICTAFGTARLDGLTNGDFFVRHGTSPLL
jgi:hypothetical protein